MRNIKIALPFILLTLFGILAGAVNWPFQMLFVSLPFFIATHHFMSKYQTNRVLVGVLLPWSILYSLPVIVLSAMHSEITKMLAFSIMAAPYFTSSLAVMLSKYPIRHFSSRMIVTYACIALVGYLTLYHLISKFYVV